MGNKIQRIYVGSTKVRPIWKREPSANTIAYYPLTSSTTVNDQSGNSRNLTNNGSVTFGTYKNIDCAYFSGSNYLYSSNVASNQQTLTVSLYMYYIYYASGNDEDIFRWGNNLGPWINVDKELKCSPGDNGTLQLTSDSGWKHCLITYNGSNTTQFYVNGTLLGSNTSATVPSGTGIAIGRIYQTNGAYFRGGISEVIMENRVWTADQVLDYYNQTKSNYGIS